MTAASDPFAHSAPFSGPSEAARLLRSIDWASTPLGPVKTWPRSLCTVVELVLSSAFPMIVLWGEELIQLYNDGYAVILGARHPEAVGRPTREVWPEVWHINEPLYAGTRRGETYYFENQLYPITRDGVLEQAYFTLCYSPVRDDGEVGGILVTVTETTAQVLAEQRLKVAAEALQLRSAEVEIRNRALEAFAQLTRDLTMETDRPTLVRSAQKIVLRLLPPGYAAYFELDAGRWRLTSQVGDLGNEELQAVVDQGLPYESQSLRQPFVSLEPFYQEQYDQGADTPAETIRHVKAAASLPVLVHGQPAGVFCVGLFEQRRWSVIDRALLETSVFNLTLALERADTLEQVATERRKLEAANEQLDAFALSISHDLRTPVRHILGFTELLGKELEQRLDERAQRHLGVVKSSALRMNGMIDVLLAFSRTAQQPLDRQPVDLSRLVGAVRADLAQDIAGREVQWIVGELPTVPGDATLLRLVLTNLLGNALKYSRPRQPARIELWAEELPRAWLVHVRDNGVGFDPRYTHRLFGMFQRLHRETEFEGNGVGLANVRRIIERHGGEVWAEGRLDEGSTLRFSLPKGE
ncbi:sensor histidine kinase [Deinococcus sp.]|uniref:sensor histidine kinase n=1 Tax=Deinococcus sp. TaxID=47478 RepID=UPI003CC6ABA5